MTGKFLLDTNIVIALFAGEAEVSHAIARTEEVFLSSVVSLVSGKSECILVLNLL